MAFENLFVRTKRSIGGITLDAVISEAHNNSVRVTKNPIELGADINDHAIVEPKRLNITAQVSDTPLGLAAVTEIVDTVTGLFGSSTSENATRSVTAYNAMVQLMEQKEPISVQTKLVLYDNMLITNISTVQDKDSSRIVLMNITLDEVIITESEVVRLSSDQLKSGSAKQQATSADNKGRKEATIPNDTTNKSVLKSVVGWIGG